MIKDLNKLKPKVKTLANKFIKECKKAGIEVIITETLRTQERQAELLSKGFSKTMNSNHLKGIAFDFAPLEDNRTINWNAKENEKWAICGEIGKSLGLNWGGDWGWDSPHLEYLGKLNTALIERLKGKLLLAVEDKGKVYYTNMDGETKLVDNNNYLEVFREMALGISNKDLNKLIK